MGDADIEDAADFRAVEESPASAVSECSDDRRVDSGGRRYCGDTRGAVLDSELVSAAHAEEIR
eukprot:111304-Alexandrium_andersonii.AAC.1